MPERITAGAAPRTSSEVERREVPELLALGRTLTGLFAGLGITQRAFGTRVHLHHTAVSRYLGGGRRPPRSFVEQLLAEVEKEQGRPLSGTVRLAVHQQFLAAVQATGREGEYELEATRDELERVRREVRDARRVVEGLQRLLEAKEDEARDLRDDLARVELEWARDRSAARAAAIEVRAGAARRTEDLLGEVAELRRQLAEAEARRRDAEERGEELRGRVVLLEERLAGLAAEARGPASAPLAELLPDLAARWDDRPAAETERILSEAVSTRPLDEVVELYTSLVDRPQTVVERFVTDVTRFREVAEVLEFGVRTMAGAPDHGLRAYVEGLSHLVAEDTVSRVSGALKDVTVPDGSRSYALADRVLYTAGLWVSVDRLTDLMVLVRPEDRCAEPSWTARALTHVRLPDSRGAAFDRVLRLDGAGWEELAVRTLAALMQDSVFDHQLRRLDDARWAKVMRIAGAREASFRVVVRTYRNAQDELGVACRFAEMLCRPQDRPRLTEYAGVLAGVGRLDVLAASPLDEVRAFLRSP
ncbi:hypothetical protein [Streptomyces sp. NPDC093225]|uniref:hypothetical protein n=1 Tax=Streptomyces sp. NPDC093225 TaxID=3366034 RepID=UPI0037FEF79F